MSASCPSGAAPVSSTIPLIWYSQKGDPLPQHDTLYYWPESQDPFTAPITSWGGWVSQPPFYAPSPPESRGLPKDVRAPLPSTSQFTAQSVQRLSLASLLPCQTSRETGAGPPHQVSLSSRVPHSRFGHLSLSFIHTVSPHALHTETDSSLSPPAASLAPPPIPPCSIHRTCPP